MASSDIPAFWDQACITRGHTGYGDALIFGYDQPLRLATVGRILDRKFPGGMAGRAALDIGCGAGDFTALLRSRGATVLGADISRVVIERTQARFAGDPQATFATGAILELDLPQQSFDVITSITVLQHVIDDDEFVRSMQALRAALRPGGFMIVLELAPLRTDTVRVTDDTGQVYLLERPASHWEKAFSRAGFEVAERPGFPQLGISLLRGLNRLITRVLGSRTAAAAAAPSAPSASGRKAQAPGLARRLMRKSLHGLRRALLLLAWPVDHLLRLPVTPARFRNYRVFVVSSHREWK
jgi:ubiquinone/menaquinone biosynthesis C-methylase UbiE